MSFASNDYLGLTSHPAVIAAAHEALDRWGTGAGLGAAHRRLAPDSRRARTRARATGSAPSARALFPTGFAANLGVLTTFGTAGVLVCSDELNHASIIDGCRLARADAAVYRHRDLDHLRDAARATAAAAARSW